MGSPQQFTKKPVTIWAVQYQPHENCQQIRQWMGEQDVRDCSNEDTDVPLCIDTLEGQMWAQPGDWIIRGVAGEFYPCKPDIFAATYEPADSSNPKDSAASGRAGRGGA